MGASLKATLLLDQAKEVTNVQLQRTMLSQVMSQLNEVRGVE